MGHPAGRLSGIGLMPLWRLRPRLSGALLLSIGLHGVLLSLLMAGSRPGAVSESVSEPLVMVAHLWSPAPPVKPPLQDAPITPSPSATDPKQATRHVVTPSAAPPAPSSPSTATPTPAAEAAPAVSLPATATDPHAERPLDLSAPVQGPTARHGATPSLAQAAREQLGPAPVSAAARLGQHMAAGAVPDCLHNAPESEGKSRAVTMGGLLALPWVAYSAMAGKCR